MGQTKLICSKMAWTKASSPNVNYRSGNYATDLAQNRGYAYLGYTVPAAIRYKPLTSIEVYTYGITTKDVVDEETWIAKTFKFVLATLSADWQESSITYNTAPAYSTAGESALSGARDLETWLMANITSYTAMKSILERGYRLQAYSPNFGSSAAAAVQVSTRYNSTSSLRPYIIVYYSDDNIYLTPTPAEKSGYVNPYRAQTFTWGTVVSQTNVSLETPTQSSARLLYKLPSASTWTTVALSGISNPSSNVYQATVPANTFPVAQQLQWKISITDSGGATHESDVLTMLTKDAVYTVAASSPAGGARVNETVANTFRWTNTSEYATSPTKADLQWSQDNSTWQNLATVNGSSTFYVAPANTFPANALVYWRVRSYNADGVASAWSPSAYFSTVAELLDATPVSPADTVESTGDAITFRWSITGTGSEYASKSDLQTSPDGSTWTTLASPTTRSYTVPAGGLAAGTLYWRVRAYNRQNVPGSWSEAVSFILYGAPATPIVSADGAPFTTITWQSSGQQAYRITVDGTLYGPFFGTDTSYQLQNFLPDGRHVITVEIQGSYGLWSDPGTYEFDVLNVPGEPVTLSGSFDVDAALSWETAEVTRDFYVYRDGAKIGHTAELSFTDRLTLGSHNWQVINRLPDGNYTPSNIVSGILTVEENLIAAVDGTTWLSLRLSANSDGQQDFSYRKSATLRHVAGATFPVLELGPFEDVSGNYDTAFSDPAQAAAFEALRGRVVVIKSRRGNVIIGALLQLQKRVADFFTAYSFTVQRIHWEEFTDDTNR